MIPSHKPHIICVSLSNGVLLPLYCIHTEGEHETTPITETTPLAPPTTTGNQATVEFSLSYTGGSDQSDEEEGRVGHQEEIVSPTIVTVL